jgi:hypothetical protein
MKGLKMKLVYATLPTALLATGASAMGSDPIFGETAREAALGAEYQATKGEQITVPADQVFYGESLAFITSEEVTVSNFAQNDVVETDPLNGRAIR